MPTLLHIDSSPLGEASISRHLTHEFIESWKKANPDGKVVTRDLTSTSIAPINATWIGAVFTPETACTPAQNELLALSDTLIAELQAADELRPVDEGGFVGDWFSVHDHTRGVGRQQEEFFDRIPLRFGIATVLVSADRDTACR